MTITLVPDPTWKGHGDAPLMIRSDAMRKLFKAGVTVAEVAVHYGVRYGLAYKAINPPRKTVDDPASTAAKPLTKATLLTMTKSRLLAIATMKAHVKVNGEVKANPHYSTTRTQAAVDELDRRYGDNWF